MRAGGTRGGGTYVGGRCFFSVSARVIIEKVTFEQRWEGVRNPLEVVQAEEPAVRCPNAEACQGSPRLRRRLVCSGVSRGKSIKHGAKRCYGTEAWRERSGKGTGEAWEGAA